MSEHSKPENRKTRWTLSERLSSQGWTLSPNLFGDAECDIHGFDIKNYKYLLNHVTSRDELVQGLRELSPLADDALAIAEEMTKRDFRVFKRALVRERDEEIESGMPQKYQALLMPQQFIFATTLAEKYDATLGAVLIRSMEDE